MSNVIALKTAPGFTPRNVQVVHILDEGNQIWGYEDTFKYRHYYHVRKVYLDDNGVWAPGKGFSVPLDQADFLIAGLQAMKKNTPKKVVPMKAAAAS